MHHLCDHSPKYPLRIGVFGDLGQSLNATVTLRHMADHHPDVILNVGDLSYADLYMPNVRAGLRGLW